MTDRMLILACSQRKRADERLLPAVERYDGANSGMQGLTASRMEGFCNRATHNLWVLLEEARWVEDRLASGNYREHYEDRLDNSIYKPLIAKAVEASVRTFGDAN